MENVLVGAGGFAREIMADLGQKLRCFVDPEFVKEGLYSISELDAEKHKVLIAIGDPNSRKTIIQKLPQNIQFWNHISSRAIILDPLVNFGEGSIICAGSVITTNVFIGNHVHVNIHSTIGHDCYISDFVTISPGVNVSGNVRIGENVMIGTNASIRERIQIDQDITVGLNSGVVKDLSAQGVYVGTPTIKKPNL